MVLQVTRQLRARIKASPRTRIVLWAVAGAFTFGVAGLGIPTDRMLFSIRDAIRHHRADQKVVVVAIDDRSIARLGSQLSHRTTDAKELDTLIGLGARRVIFDKTFADPGSVEDDSAFEAALLRHPGRVVLAARFDVDPRTGAKSSLLPIPLFRERAELGSVAIWRDWMGYSGQVPYTIDLDGRTIPAMAALLAGVRSLPAGMFRPDYSVDASSIPSVSLVDVLDKAPAAQIVRGKDVIIGAVADSLGDTHTVPRQGPIPGVYIPIIAAETLRQRFPLELGWGPGFIAAFVIGTGIALARRKTDRRLLLAAGAGVMCLTPILADEFQVRMDISPGAVLLAIVATGIGLLHRAKRNVATGLPVLNTASGAGEHHPFAIAALKIRDYAGIRAALTATEEATLLAEIARRLSIADATSDLIQGDDSFVWRTGMALSPALYQHMEGLHAVLSQPITVGARQVDLSVGLGIEGEVDRDVAQRNKNAIEVAEEAAASHQRFQVYDPQRSEDADFRLSLLSRIGHGIANGEIWVAYQPKLDVQQQRLVGVEALVRWTHPERGQVPPDQFIPAASRAGRLDGLTSFVLDTAVRDANIYRAIDPEFSVAVNIAVRSLENQAIVEEVQATLARHHFPAAQLTLEVTEGEKLDPAGIALDTLAKLRALGVTISIDDYGTEYSTLDYVRQFPASEVKLDRRFVQHVHDDTSSRVLVESTITMAHGLGMKVVAEGVELPETMAALTDMGCDMVQGYLISRAKPIAELRSLIMLANRQVTTKFRDAA